MVTKTEIQVFVSCPGDVEDEKKITEAVCRDLTDSIENYCNVSFHVKEWQTIVGHFGERPQGIINEQIGKYDVYLGIWWMRFGTRTGAINPFTGTEYESGTQEEFVLAYEEWKENKNPLIYLFFKKYRIPLDSEIEQLKRIKDFKQEQLRNGWLHNFEDKLDFQRRVHKILTEMMLKFCFSKNSSEKQKIISEESIRINEFPIYFATPSYVERTMMHFAQFKPSRQNPFGEKIYDRLIKLIDNHRRIVILGDAGSGKSTEIKNLAYLLSNNKSQYFPILQQFNTYTPEQGLENFLPEIWKTISPHLLVILWDGLDEIQPQHFNSVARQINSFSGKHPEIRIVITSRNNFYELPVNNSPGTLTGFEPYYISNMRLRDIKEYFGSRFETNQSDKFIKDIFKAHLEGLAVRPFFLLIISELYASGNGISVSRSTLYESYLNLRIVHDQAHYLGTFDLRTLKLEVMALLEKVALSMEILGKNLIDEDGLLKLINGEQYSLLKYCTAFKKKEGEELIWQFEHNNIQEYLAAKALSRLPFQKILQFISFEPDFKKIIPTWVNTLTFLFSIIDKKTALLNDLIDWLIKNGKEAIVKMEKEKISPETRAEIFKSIFNHYKQLDIWISSNTFSSDELAKFGQSEMSIAFLMNEIKDPSSSRINKANAINVIGYFDYSDNDTAEAMETFLLSFIELNINDDEYIHSVIYSLKWAQLTGDRTINELMRLLGNRKNQYIRSAMYSILSVSPSIDLHIDYILEGVDLRYRKEPERESTSLIDERWNLKECVVAICTANGLKKLIEFIISQYHFDYGYNEGETINMILNNSINAFEHDNSLLKLLLKWFLNELKTFNPKRAELILRFFDDTGTREQAFYEIWERSEEGEDRAAALVRLANPSLLNFVIQCYNEHDITNNDLKKFYKDLEWIKSPLLSLFEGLIEEKTNFILEKPAYRDLAAERKKKMDDDFGILFKADTLKKEVSKIFEEEDVLELSFDELFEIRRQHHKPKEMEEHYSGSALRLLRDFCDPDTVVSKADILAWFNNLEMVEWYCVQRIYEILTNNSDLSPGTDQIDWLRNWCYKNINKIDFTNENALRSLMAIYIFYFSVKFNIDYEKEILLSMLSFDYYQDNSPLRTDYLLNKIQKGDIEKRIIENLKKGVKDDNVLKNHVRFAVANKLIEAFPFIRKELINMERNEYSRQELLNIYFPASLDMPGLKSILRDSDHLIRWSILAKLLESGEEQFLISFLMEILTSDNVSDEKLRASEYLILLEQREGVEYLLDELENKPSENLFFQRPNLLNSLRNKDWIPYLMKLLEIGYENNISIDRFENLQSSATTALYNLALLNEENFAAVKENLEAFLQKYKSAYPNVKFLASVIERMEAQFYMNRAQSFTIDQAINKLKILG